MNIAPQTSKKQQTHKLQLKHTSGFQRQPLSRNYNTLPQFIIIRFYRAIRENTTWQNDRKLQREQKMFSPDAVTLKADCNWYGLRLFKKPNVINMPALIATSKSCALFHWVYFIAREWIFRHTYLLPRWILENLWKASWMTCHSKHVARISKTWSCTLKWDGKLKLWV